MHYLHQFLSEFRAWDFGSDVAYFKLAFLIYVAAWVVYLVHLFAHNRTTAGIATVLLVAGLGVHTVSIVIRAVHAGELPSISLYEMVSTTIWGILFLYFVTQVMSKMTVLGAFVMPVALAMMAYAMFLTKAIRDIMPVLQSFWLYIHVPIAVVAYGSLAVVFGLAFAYLFRDGRDNLVWIGIGAVVLLIALGMVVGNHARAMKPPIWIEGERFASGKGAKAGAVTDASGGRALDRGWTSATWRFALKKPMEAAAVSVDYLAGSGKSMTYELAIDGRELEINPIVLGGSTPDDTEGAKWLVQSVGIGELGPGKHAIELRAIDGTGPIVDALVVASLAERPVSAGHLEMYRKPSMMGPAAVFAVLGLIPLLAGLMMTRSGAAAGESRRGQFWLERLPSLKEMDAIMSRLVALGFITLTLVIVTGAIWAADAWGRPWGWDPKEVASLIPWLFYAVYLHMRHIAGWRGLPAVLLLFFGYIGVIFCLILVNLLPTGLHGYSG
jgi:ABC-type transport system involved in cytochrome c biogenesis permease subunit